ncbi:MAG: multicopper oxidase family protein [Thermoleophilia bacterium]
MQAAPRRIIDNWGFEAAICLSAAVLAFVTLAAMEALHGLIFDLQGAAGTAHFVRDGLLLLPLALAAVIWGLPSDRRRRAGLTQAAAHTTTAFVALLVPGAAAHTVLHRSDMSNAAHAAAPGAGAMTTGSDGGEGIASVLLHAAADAFLVFPVAFVLSLAALALLRSRREQPVLRARRGRLLVLAVPVIVAAGAAAIAPVSAAESPAYPKFAAPLVIPPVLTGQDIEIDIAQTQEQILPGNPTTMWTYDGSFPGPLIRRPTGVPTNVTFTNNLPAGAGSLSVHHHGTQAPEEDDGHPSYHLIEPGAKRTYTYPGVDNGAPERAAPQWYHDHRDMVTGRNVWMGLMGAFIYDDPLEQSLDLPQGEHDVPLMVTDREFDADNQIPYTFVQSGTFGDVILVNGVPQPFFDVGDRRYRLRLYNVSNRREYRFALSNGQTMTQIGTDSGLLPEPVARTSIKLGPAERADVVVDFAGHLGEDVVLQNLDAPFGPGDRDGEVMQFRVTQDVVDDSAEVPGALRPVFATDEPVTTRVWNLDRTGGRWTINGRPYDPARVDAHPVLGTTERWIFRNPTPLPHVAHVHLGDQKLVSRNGGPPPAHERVKESWFLAPGEEVVIDIKFTDYVGKFIFHCHMLEHEDDAMMTQFQTVRPAAPPVAPPSGGPAPPGGGVVVAPTPVPAAPAAAPGAPRVSRAIRILSPKRLRHIVRRGIRFESGVTVGRRPFRAELRVRGRRVGVARRTPAARGRYRVTLRLSRQGRLRLRRLLASRRRVAAQLYVTLGDETRVARFSIWR